MEFVSPAPPIPALDVEGEKGRFPVYRIFCVGRNYAEHVREMGHDPNREPPFFFMKPASAIVTGNADFPYPSATKDVHHEMELVVAIVKGGSKVNASGNCREPSVLKSPITSITNVDQSLKRWSKPAAS
jgi:fumarylpyruvate hydrolase